jgi:hypothetical protein
MKRVLSGKEIILKSTIQKQISEFQLERERIKFKDLNSQKSELIQIMANYLTQKSTRVNTIDNLTNLETKIA